MSISLEAVHPVLMSSDLTRSVSFFTRLGFTVTFQDSPASPRYVAVARDAVTLHLQWQDRSQWACAHDRPTYRFLVEDPDGLFETFQGAGAIAASSSPWAAPGDTPWGTREFHVLDPDGNGLQFYRSRPGRSVPEKSRRCARDAGQMRKNANARFAIKGWDERPYVEGQDQPRLTRASVTKTYTGDIDGQGQVEYLMMYRSDGSAAFVGLERIVGRIGGRTGTFVLQRTGIFESGQAKESYFVIPGSATGELQGLLGDGASAVGHGMEHPFVLSYELA